MTTTLKPENDIKAKLLALVGHDVRLTLGDDCDTEGFYIKVVGKLETSGEEYPDSYYVRIADGYHGTSSIGFTSKQVRRLLKQVYTTEISLNRNCSLASLQD